ncbi:MAG TPA: MarR family transcriptional regulator [Dermatophilaceae bacterium]|nr:MarR family transcriptional regulator [Dermatophilaceae bacterium]
MTSEEVSAVTTPSAPATASPSAPATAAAGSGTARMTRDQQARLAGDLRLACMRISRRVRYESDDALAPHQFSVLVQLHERPRTPRALAEVERVSAPSMTRTATGLVERGLVSRTGDPTDGRSVILALTPEGRRVLRETRRRRDEWLAVRLAALPDDERELLRRATEVLARVAAG